MCPGCRRMLRLATDDEVPPPTVVGDPHAGEAAGAEGGVAPHGRLMRKSDTFDESFSDKEGVQDLMVKRLLAAIVATLVLALVGGAVAWKLQEQAEVPAPVVVVPDEAKVTPMPEVERKVSLSEVEPVVKSFLEAPTLEAMLGFVRHPERTRPRVEKYYEEDGYQPPGLRQVSWQTGTEREGTGVSVIVQDGNFDEYRLWLVDEDGWKVDWEATEGWRPVDWGEYRKLKPVEPMTFRVVPEGASYFNFNFDDESEWSCFALRHPDESVSIYGYVKRGGELDDRLHQLALEGKPVMLRVRFPEGPGSDHQVLIDGVVAASWFDPAGDP